VPTAVAMPKLGMTMEEGTVVNWLVALGEPTLQGHTVLVIESEKAEVEIEAAATGVLRHVYVPEGETVPCGTLLAAITPTADEPFDADAFHGAENRPEQPRVEPIAAAPISAAPAASPGATGEPRRAFAPAARALARKLAIDLDAVTGSGPRGRVTKEDVEAYAERRKALVTVADDVALEVPSQGEGEPVLLLPGFGVDVSAFARQVPVLAERMHVRGVNPRGVGLSDAPEGDRYDVATTAEDAATLVDGPAHVIGASLGAAAALELALFHPQKVRTVTLITPFLEADGRLIAVAEAWSRIAAEASSQTLASALLPWLFSPQTLTDDAIRARLSRGLAATVARVPAATLTRALAGLRAWSGTRLGDVASLSVPSLVIAGGADLLTPNAESVASALPSAKLVSIPNAGHAVALEAPDEVNRALLSHLA